MEADLQEREDILAELDARYEEAVRKREREVVQTFDILDIWSEETLPFVLYRLWKGTVKGDIPSTEHIGCFFDWHNDEVKNERYDKPELAKYWYRIGADAGYAASQYGLGCLLRLTKRVSDSREAIALFEKAAAQEHRNAMEVLAQCLKCGRCVKVDVARSEELLRRAKELGSKEGQSEKEEVNG